MTTVMSMHDACRDTCRFGAAEATLGATLVLDSSSPQ